jgi:hypothetical protein
MATDGLLPLREVTGRLRIVGQHYAGLQTIPIERIVGSVDRFFRLRRREMRARLDRLRAAFADRPMPPITAYEASGLYFVSDGHHRVALARQEGGEFIDAEVTALALSHELHPGVDLLELVHTEQHRLFKERTGLLVHHPEAKIVFSRPIGYGQPLDVITAHAYELSAARGKLVPMPEATADWYEKSWQPAQAAIRASELPRRYSFKTEGDLYLWVHARLRELQTTDSSAGWAQAAAAAAAEPVTRSHRDETLRQQRTPLPRVR